LPIGGNATIRIKKRLRYYRRQRKLNSSVQGRDPKHNIIGLVLVSKRHETCKTKINQEPPDMGEYISAEPNCHTNAHSMAFYRSLL
jgi:hypothetical protein